MVHEVYHTFSSLNVAGHAICEDDLWIGKPVASLSWGTGSIGWHGDSESDLPEVEQRMREKQRNLRDLDDVRQMQPHIVLAPSQWRK